MTDLNGRAALVTGASRGIGAALARMLHAAGAGVGLISRSGDDLGLDGALGVACDVRDAAAVDAATAKVAERFGGIDILVVNAGVGTYGPFTDLPPDDLEEIIDVNVKGALYAVRAALPHLLRSDAADVVMVASEAGRRGFPGEAVYCASKFAQVGFMRALDGELREKGVRCTNLCPGGVATDFAMGRGRGPGDTDGMMTAEEIADLAMYVITRPRGMRILECALRPMIEASWG
ncbi:MAG: SDR family NAD(P)-dependent oxidoreductase [Thermoleophilia bacterium]|nr:SDR family NAD(P)-dependent oxidoreductase [Thermoleophilia bacterium]